MNNKRMKRTLANTILALIGLLFASLVLYDVMQGGQVWLIPVMMFGLVGGWYLVFWALRVLGEGDDE